MPPFSLALTVLTSTFMSTGDRFAAAPAWQVSRNQNTLPGRPCSELRSSSCDTPLIAHVVVV